MIKQRYTGPIAQWLERWPAMQKVLGSNPGRAAWILVYYWYSCGSIASFGWDVKPRSGLRAHAFKNMRGPKRSWMTKRKSRGPETYRYDRHINPTKAE